MSVNHIMQEDFKEIVNAVGKCAFALSGKTVVITGGLGFIGRYIVGTINYLNEHTLPKPCKIIVIDNRITSPKGGLSIIHETQHCKYIEQDIVSTLHLEGKINYIIHAAGIASPFYYRKYPFETLDVAVTGTRNMLEIAKKKKVESFLFFSSSEIYGDPTPDVIPTKETYNGNVSPIGPRSYYDESKRLGETLCMMYRHFYKTPSKIVRPFNIFGPGMRPDDHRVIPSYLFNALNDKPIQVYSSGVQTRTFCYISDAVTGFLLALLCGKDGEVYNVGNDRNEIDMSRLAKIFNQMFNNKLRIEHVPYPKGYPQGEPQRRCPDLAKVKNELGYFPKIDIEKGLERTLRWCTENWT